MNKRFVLSFALAFGCLCFGGCSKKDAAAEGEAGATTGAAASSAPAKGGEVLPGAADVRAALQSKNYDRAVGGLMALQAALATDEQRTEYANLFQEVRDTLMDASATDKKAAEAMAQLRLMRNQR